MRCWLARVLLRGARCRTELHEGRDRLDRERGRATGVRGAGGLSGSGGGWGWWGWAWARWVDRYVRGDSGRGGGAWLSWRSQQHLVQWLPRATVPYRLRGSRITPYLRYECSAPFIQHTSRPARDGARALHANDPQCVGSSGPVRSEQSNELPDGARPMRQSKYTLQHGVCDVGWLSDLVSGVHVQRFSHRSNLYWMVSQLHSTAWGHAILSDVPAESRDCAQQALLSSTSERLTPIRRIS
jgi:hypothetical protein